MSTQHKFTIDVVSAASLSPDEEAELRSALEGCAGNIVLKKLAQAWRAENSGERLNIEMPEGKGAITEGLKFRELEFFKDQLGEAMQIDDDRKVVIKLEDDQLSSNRVAELYAVLVFLGSLVGGWESDSEFSWENPNRGTSAFFWEGDGQIFPESDFN
jgi:hypothetical protein